MSRELEPLLADIRRDLTALTEHVCAALDRAAQLLSERATSPDRPTTPGPEVLTSREAAELLRVHRRTLERLNLPSVKLGRLRRYLREDILEWLRQKSAAGRGSADEPYEHRRP